MNNKKEYIYQQSPEEMEKDIQEQINAYNEEMKEIIKNNPKGKTMPKGNKERR